MQKGPFVVEVPPETAEDALSLTDVLSESRRLRKWEEALHFSTDDKSQPEEHKEPAVAFRVTKNDKAEASVSVSIIDRSVRPKGKNPFSNDG